MERLTEKRKYSIGIYASDKFGCTGWYDAYDLVYDGKSCAVDDILERLAELEDKIEQGTLIELPCKVGDRVYTIDIDSNGKRHIEETQIAEIRIYSGGIYYQDHLGVWLFEIFLTREETEKRLKELQNG